MLDDTTQTPTSGGMRTFAIVWVGQVVSMLGSQLTGFGIAIWTFQQTGSVTQLSLVMLAVAVPGILLAPIAGASVDRFDRRYVMLISDAIAGAATMFLVALFWADALQFWQVLLAVATSGSAGAFQEPAYLASIPTLVPKDRLGRANGLVQLGPAIGTLVAPALAGALLLTSGLWAILLIDVVTFSVAVGTLTTVRFPPVESTSGTKDAAIREQTAAGFRYLRKRPGMLRLILMAAGLNLAFGFASVLYAPLFLSFTNEAVLGIVMSIAGLGMVGGSLLMSAWGGPTRRVRGMIVMVVGMGVALIIAGLRPSVLLAALAAAILFFFIPLLNGTSQSLWQLKVDLDMQGRVFSTRRMLAVAATPIAYVVAGPLADRVFEPAMAADGALSASLGPDSVDGQRARHRPPLRASRSHDRAHSGDRLERPADPQPGTRLPRRDCRRSRTYGRLDRASQLAHMCRYGRPSSRISRL